MPFSLSGGGRFGVRPSPPSAPPKKRSKWNLSRKYIGRKYWRWRTAEPYKNAILKDYQIALEQCGIPNGELKPFLAQIIQENGALDPEVIGDYGYSFGIGQWYTYPVPAKQHLREHPEQRSLAAQIKMLSSAICKHYDRYDGDTKRAVIHHNRPAAARRGEDSCRMVAGRFTCYWRDEVAKRLDLLTL